MGAAPTPGASTPTPGVTPTPGALTPTVERRATQVVSQERRRPPTRWLPNHHARSKRRQDSIQGCFSLHVISPSGISPLQRSRSYSPIRTITLLCHLFDPLHFLQRLGDSERPCTILTSRQLLRDNLFHRAGMVTTGAFPFPPVSVRAKRKLKNEKSDFERRSLSSIQNQWSR